MQPDVPYMLHFSKLQMNYVRTSIGTSNSSSVTQKLNGKSISNHASLMQTNPSSAQCVRND